MKTIKLISFFVLTCLYLNANAQLRVQPNGRVQAGLFRDGAAEDPGNVISMSVFGKNGDYRSGSKLAFGDFGRIDGGWNPFIGEYGTNDTDQLWLHGKLGTYLTSGGSANNIVAYYDPALNTNFVFNTNLRVNGINITSDARLKENVKSLHNASDILGKLNGVTYNYSLSEIQESRKMEESQPSELSTQGFDSTGQITESAFDTNGTDAAKASKDSEIQRWPTS